MGPIRQRLAPQAQPVVRRIEIVEDRHRNERTPPPSTNRTRFSIWPFSRPAAGVQATGSIA